MSSAPQASSFPTNSPSVAAFFRKETDELREYNRLGLDYRQFMPRPKVNGTVLDCHNHLMAARHAKDWIESATHYGFDAFVTMSPLEEATVIQREWPGKFHFITIPAWQNPTLDDWLRRLEMFYNMGSRIIKFHMAPGTMVMRNWNFQTPEIQRMLKEASSRGMLLMSHVGDPDTWYRDKYTDLTKYGTREAHYALWEATLEQYRGHPWLGAHLGGNPENLARLQSMLDRFPDLYLDCSATRWMVREISPRRDEARDFFIRNADRILYGSDQVSGDRRGFDFLSSRWWAHRKLWETAHVGPSPIFDPDLKEDEQPTLRGLALPDEVLQKIYHDTPMKLLDRVGAKFL
jgi:hypothetical protein